MPIEIIYRNDHCEWIDVEAPTPEEVEHFLALVRAAEIQITIRNPRGRDISAACGQLAYNQQKVVYAHTEST